MNTAAKSIPAHATMVNAASLKPKEHGAYVILVTPIATALLIAGVGVVGVAVSVASIAGFFAHEPLLVALGHRGARAKRCTPLATSRAISLIGLGVIGGTTAMWLGSPAVRISLVACLTLAVAGFAVASMNKHRTIGGQLLGVTGLSIPCVPILLSGDVSLLQSLSIWTIWLIGFTSTTVAMHAMIAAQKRRSRVVHWSAFLSIVLVVAVSATTGITWPLVSIPMIAMSAYLMRWPPPARQLKTVGWSLVVGTIASAISMIAVFAPA